MRKQYSELTECYTYDSYNEFKEHYEVMLQKGFTPNSDSSKPEYYSRHQNLTSYYAQYWKRET